MKAIYRIELSNIELNNNIVEKKGYIVKYFMHLFSHIVSS